MFQRRLILLIAFWLRALAILIARLVWLQIDSADEYQQASRKLLETSPRWLNTVRGSIYDRRGQVLAEDRPDFTVCFHYEFTRLYDDRFWEYQRYQYLKQEINRDRDDAEVKAYLNEKFGSQCRKAEQLLVDLAEICQLSLDALNEHIKRINDNIYILRASRARRLWYKRQKMKYRPASNAQEILADFSRILPENASRLEWLYRKTDILEMNEPQRAFSVSKEIALLVEERFVGANLTDSRSADRPVTVVPSKARYYPYNAAACHLIGQIGPVPHDWLQKRRPRQKPPEPNQLGDYYLNDRRGDWGIERVFEKQLRGRRGWEHKNIDRNPITPRIDPIFGSDVKLTIDIKLQQDIRNILVSAHDLEGAQKQKPAYRGAAVVIDVPTGQVLAMVSVPEFDLNTYYQKDHYKSINDPNDPDKRRMNRALSVPYQPGSTIKTAMLLGALRHGIVTENTTIDCFEQNKWWAGSPSHIYNHGAIGSVEAIQRSCNFYFIKIGRQWGPASTVNWLKQCGFGKKILTWPPHTPENEVRLALRETRGYLAPLDPARSRKLPTEYHLRFMSIGLNPLKTSVLHMAQNAATIARHGTYLAPSLVLNPKPAPISFPIASPAQAKIVQNGMYAAINQRGGTAYEAFHPLPWPKEQVELFGKTGSTDYSLFVCYARTPAGQCLTLAVLAEVEANGGEVAAPLARRILLACAEHEYLPPVPSGETP